MNSLTVTPGIRHRENPAPETNGELEPEGTWMSKEQIKEQIVELNRNTRIPIGVAIACAIAFLSGAVWLNTRLDAIDHRLSGMERSLLDRWTARDMQIFALEFRMANPGVTVPDVNKIKSQ